MNKEKLRELFGSDADIIPELESIFGDVYLDSPDKTKEDIPTELEVVINATGGQIANVGHLLNTAVEKSPIINCQENQVTILNFLNGYIAGGDSVGVQEWWAVMKHMDNCTSSPCENLYKIACMDKYLTPEGMLKTYGEDIKNWKIDKT